MREYYELWELVVETGMDGILQEGWQMTVRYEVTGFTPQDKEATIQDLLALATNITKACILDHECGHDTSPGKPCQRMVIYQGSQIQTPP